jgi:hypothetical protein
LVKHFLISVLTLSEVQTVFIITQITYLISCSESWRPNLPRTTFKIFNTRQSKHFQNIILLDLKLFSGSLLRTQNSNFSNNSNFCFKSFIGNIYNIHLLKVNPCKLGKSWLISPKNIEQYCAILILISFQGRLFHSGYSNYFAIFIHCCPNKY